MHSDKIANLIAQNFLLTQRAPCTTRHVSDDPTLLRHFHSGTQSQRKQNSCFIRLNSSIKPSWKNSLTLDIMSSGTKARWQRSQSSPIWNTSNHINICDRSTWLYSIHLHQCIRGCIQESNPGLKKKGLKTGCYENSNQKSIVNPIKYLALIQINHHGFIVDVLYDQVY